MTLALGLLAAAQVAVVSGQTPGASADQSVLSKFLDSTEPLTQYRAVQRLEARNQRFKKHGWMDVRTELTAEGVFSFEVLAEGGSGYIRNKVLRPVLEGERDVLSRDRSRTALTTSNYAIGSEEPVGPGLVRLTVTPLSTKW